MTGGAQVMFVVEYPCDRFCRIEVDLSGERGQVTLQQMRDKADGLHQREHEPENGEAEAEAGAPVVEPETSGRPAATIFLAAPGQGASSAPGHGASPRRGHERRR
ncbi:hypothetical protein BJ973_006033 [Actinoplanes tereljensis]|uniref:Uncharacterized protein n=1 Tax=Paractinoplanes tereljensis TaxID=571912 RepID=A0A919NJ68_9ACTN|nr:hypothetical protein [Actinoplanes tereljensis]GIF18986.1 hypothetical protein Ate02nite_17160 [Actinoplanes tereljensis]